MIKNKKQNGFTLIELLITLVIVTIALLGISALQLKSLQNSYASYQRTLAIVQANDVAEHLWANACNVYTDISASPLTTTTTFDEIVADWVTKNQNQSELKSWGGVVTQDTVDSRLFKATVTWDDKKTEGTQQSVTQSFSIPILNCL